MRPKVAKIIEGKRGRRPTNMRAIFLRLPNDMVEKLRIIAERESRSVSMQVAHYLKQIMGEKAE